MNLLTIARCLLVAVAVSLGAAHATSVGNWYDIDAPDGVIRSITYKSKTYNMVTASPAVYLDDQVWYYTGNLTPQNSTNIAGYVEDQYDLASGSLRTVAYCDSDHQCTGGASMTNANGKSAVVSTFNSVQPFDYLAVHLGLGELLFHWTV